MARMPADIRVTIGFEESYQESLDFLEAMFRAGRDEALRDGKNDLAEHYRLRLDVLDFQRKWVKEQVEFSGDEGAIDNGQLTIDNENTAETAVQDLSEVPE